MNDEGVLMVNIRELEQGALERFSECPKHLTIVRHADKEEDSALHCVPVAKPGESHVERNFIVPGQEVMMVEDPNYGLFSVIRVSDSADGPESALITSVRSRLGFLLPLSKLPSELFGMKAKAC